MAVVSWRDSPIQAEGSVICTCLLFIVTITVVYYTSRTAYELGCVLRHWNNEMVALYSF